MKTKSWDKNQLIVAAKESFSYRQVLHKIGLKEAGGNYTQIKKYLAEYKINIKHFRGKGWNRGTKGLGVARISLEEILRPNSSFHSY